MTKPSLLLCVPGPWKSRDELAALVAESTNTEFVVEDELLTRPIANQQVRLAVSERDPALKAAFEAAGQGNLSVDTLTAIEGHASVAYLAFEDVLIEEREKVGDFSNLMRQLGGHAVKVESSALAHEWSMWLAFMTSENPVDWYQGVVVLFRDEDEQCYCSCGMHHFGLLDVAAPASMGQEAAADLINQFNIFQIGRRPVLKDGQTFSLAAHSADFRMKAVRDHRHPVDDLLHNPHGVWKFEAKAK